MRPRRFGADARATFLRALSETGNLSLAAAEAGVSRSCVERARHADAALDAAAREALAAARACLGGAERVAPADGWADRDGRALLVRGRGAKRCQIARARADDWRPEDEARVLALLEEGYCIKRALSLVGRSRLGGRSHGLLWPAFLKRARAAYAADDERNRLEHLLEGPARWRAFGLPVPREVMEAAARAAEALGVPVP